MDMKRLYTLATILLVIYKVRAADDDVRMPPTLRVSPPREIIFKPGVQVTLPCEAAGRPPVKEYEWTKNGLTLDLNSPSIVPSADETVGTILITPQDARDEGNYRCSAKNQWGTVVSDNSRAILAFIQSLPQLPPIITTTTEGDPLRLPCTQSKSVPNVTYFWSTGSSTIDPNTVTILPSSRLSVSDQGDLYFAYTTPEDNQKNRIYKCNLKNAELDTTLGGSYTTIKVTSRSIDQVAVAQKYVSQPTLTAIKGRPFSFRCIFSGKPAPRIEWQRQNGALDWSRCERQDFDTRLIIKSVIEDDAGTYTCTGSQPNTAGSNAVTHSMTLAVKVVPEFANDADYPHDINATEGGTVSISCKSYAVPAATVKWFKDGVPLQSNQKQQVSLDGLTLTLVDLCRDSTVCGKPDLMVISCNASNDYGYAYTSGFVNVLKKSVITKDLPKSIELAPPQPQELTCEGSSDPGTSVSINWYFNGYLITNESGKYEVYNNSGSTLLRIMTTEQARGGRLAGSYMCNVTNGYSSSSQSIDITLPPGVADGLATASIPWWIIVTILMIILFLVIIFLCCYQCIKRNKGDLYEVDKSERKTGNDPEKDLIIAGFHDYQRQEETDAPAVLKSARGSLGSVMTLSNEPFERGTGPVWNVSTEDLTAA